MNFEKEEQIFACRKYSRISRYSWNSRIFPARKYLLFYCKYFLHENICCFTVYSISSIHGFVCWLWPTYWNIFQPTCASCPMSSYVSLYVCLSVWAYGTYVVDHCNGTELCCASFDLRCAPLPCVQCKSLVHNLALYRYSPGVAVVHNAGPIIPDRHTYRHMRPITLLCLARNVKSWSRPNMAPFNLKQHGIFP